MMSVEPTGDGQKRAPKGGAIGANGEWYEGGKFIATKDNHKSSPVRFQPRTLTAEEQAISDEIERRSALRQAWISERRSALAGYINKLIDLANPWIFCGETITAEKWREMVAAGAGGFYVSLAKELEITGFMSERQAFYAAKGLLGRRTRRNEAEFDALVETFATEFDGGSR